MASVSKASRPRSTSLLTRNGKARIKLLTLIQLQALFEKTPSKRTKSKIRTRILLLEKRQRKVAV